MNSNITYSSLLKRPIKSASQHKRKKDCSVFVLYNLMWCGVKWTVFPQYTYNLNLAASKLHVFAPLLKFLAGIKFRSN